jgi:hypothetical protein
MQIWSTNSGWFQVFQLQGEYFVNPTNDKVLEVYQSKDEEGQAIKVGGRAGKDAAHQRWKVVYVDSAQKLRTKGFNKEFGFHINRPFYIRSRMPMQRIIECISANNTTLKRWRNNTRQQQWYFDEVSKTIKNNYWKSHSLDIQGNGGSSNLRCTGTNSRWWQLFRYQDSYVVNERGKVVEVQGTTDAENRNIGVNNKSNKIQQ